MTWGPRHGKASGLPRSFPELPKVPKGTWEHTGPDGWLDPIDPLTHSPTQCATKRMQRNKIFTVPFEMLFYNSLSKKLQKRYM